MAEMPNHEVGDAVFVREEQQEKPYPAKVHSLPANQTYVEIAKDENNDIKLVPHFKVIPQKEGMYVLVTSDKGTDSATIVSFDKATEQYALMGEEEYELGLNQIYGFGKYANGDEALLTDKQADFNNSCQIPKFENIYLNESKYGDIFKWSTFGLDTEG